MCRFILLCLSRGVLINGVVVFFFCYGWCTYSVPNKAFLKYFFLWKMIFLNKDNR